MLKNRLHADDLVLYSESEEDMKVMMQHFIEMRRRRGLKLNADKSKVMVLGGKMRDLSVRSVWIGCDWRRRQS